MMKHFTRILFCSLVLLSNLSLAEEGGNYWVVGSYQIQAEAIKQGERLSGVTGVEVLMLPTSVEGQTIYKLLVRLFTDQYDQQRLRAQLKYSGVTDVSDTNIQGNEPGLRSLFAVVDYDLVEPDLEERGLEEQQVLVEPDFAEQGEEGFGSMSSNEMDNYQIQDFADERSDLQPSPFLSSVQQDGTADEDKVGANFVVVGSYRELDAALSQQMKLSGQFGEVYVKKAQVNGVEYHRTLVGPVDASEEAALIARIDAFGISGAWVWRGVRVEDVAALFSTGEYSSEEFSPEESASVVSAPKASTRAERFMQTNSMGDSDTAGQDKSEADDFNLAKLKKGNRPYFLPERN